MMKLSRSMMRSMILGAVVAVSLPMALPMAAQADEPGRHPYYVHALSDLRAARWLLAHRTEDLGISIHEELAIREIDAAIHEASRAAWFDGKNLNDHPPVDVPRGHEGRIRQAEVLLREAFADINREEDDRYVRELKHRSLDHIGAAIHQADAILDDIFHHHYRY